MGMLCDLPGVEETAVEATGAKSRTAMVRLAREGKYPIAAGDNGSIAVWRRDDAQYQCEFHRFKSRIDKLTTWKLSEVKVWLREWWPQMGR